MFSCPGSYRVFQLRYGVSVNLTGSHVVKPIMVWTFIVSIKTLCKFLLGKENDEEVRVTSTFSDCNVIKKARSIGYAFFYAHLKC